MTSLVIAHTVCTEKGGYLFVNMADKISLLPLCRTRYIFQTRPGTYYLEAGILSEAYLPLFHCQPMMKDRPGIPLITKLLQSGNFFLLSLKNHYICATGHRNSKNEFGNVKTIIWIMIKNY